MVSPSSKLKTHAFPKTLNVKTRHRPEEIFIKHMSDKGLVSRIYKEFSKLKKKINYSI